jgi:hypothetical protein
MSDRIKEDFSNDGLSRLETLSRDKTLLLSVARLLRREEDPQHYEDLFKTVLVGREAPFDALETAQEVAGWISELEQATARKAPWAEIERIFMKRENAVTKAWSANLFTVPLDQIKAPDLAVATKATPRPLNSIVAYELVGTYPVLMGFATQCVYRRDATLVTLAQARMGSLAKNLSELEAYLPGVLQDPLSGQAYVFDAENQRLRTKAKSVGTQHLLLKSLILDGFPVHPNPSLAN